ncbi:MAG: tRNA pseudouridine(38-40) synthase TruA [Nitrospirota bacterium]|nr:tRNA pseudouridine(38-40) synthase TruA [Nitrospirota bacterium]
MADSFPETRPAEMPSEAGPSRRIRLTLQYDGGAYAGWQEQPDAVSIQSTLQGILARMEKRPVALVAAGRTDAGVHALGQVAHFDTATGYPADTFLRALNAQLPPDIAVVAADDVAGDFHARHSAQGKHYRYRVLNRPAPCPFRRRYAWYVPRELDVEAMGEGAGRLLGEHDFSSFRASGCGAAHPRRTLTRLDVSRVDDEVVFDVEGPAFLKQMVRNLVGTLMVVGRGRHSPDWVGNVLAARDRTVAGETAPAWGLTLVRVFYAQSPVR